MQVYKQHKSQSGRCYYVSTTSRMYSIVLITIDCSANLVGVKKVASMHIQDISVLLIDCLLSALIITSLDDDSWFCCERSTQSACIISVERILGMNFRPKNSGFCCRGFQCSSSRCCCHLINHHKFCRCVDCSILLVDCCGFLSKKHRQLQFGSVFKEFVL
jgi:hypothetical protein